MGDHAAEGVAPGRRQLQEAAQGGPAGAGQGSRSARQLLPDDDALLEAVDRLVGQGQVVRVHHLAQDEVAAQVPVEQLLVVDAAGRVGGEKGRVPGFRGLRDPAVAAVGGQHRRRGLGAAAGLVEHGALFGGQLGVPLGRARLPGLRTGAGLEADAAGGESVVEQAQGAAALPRAQAVDEGAGEQQQVAGTQPDPAHQPQVALALQQAGGRGHVRLVAGLHEDQPAGFLVDVGQGPDGAHELALAAVVLVVIGQGRVAGLVATGEGAVEAAAGRIVGDQPRQLLQAEAAAADLVEVVNQDRVHEQVAEGFALLSGPAEHPLRPSHTVEGGVDGQHLRRLQGGPHDEVAAHVEAVVLLVGHPASFMTRVISSMAMRASPTRSSPHSRSTCRSPL